MKLVLGVEKTACHRVLHQRFLLLLEGRDFRAGQRLGLTLLVLKRLALLHHGVVLTAGAVVGQELVHALASVTEIGMVKNGLAEFAGFLGDGVFGNRLHNFIVLHRHLCQWIAAKVAQSQPKRNPSVLANLPGFCQTGPITTHLKKIMPTAAFTVLAFLLPCRPLGADSIPKAGLLRAVAALADQPGYRWTATAIVAKSSIGYLFPTPGSQLENTNDPICCDDGSNVVHMAYFIAAHSDPSAIAKAGLGSKVSADWRSGIAYPVFRIEGEAQNDGLALFKLSPDSEANQFQIVTKSGKAVVKIRDAWLSQYQLDYSADLNRGFAWISRQMKTPVSEATALLTGATNITSTDSGYTADLNRESVEALLAGPPGGDHQLTAAFGHASFRVVDGKLTEYEFRLRGEGTPSNGLNFDWTFTVTITGASAAPITVPKEALVKLRD